MIGKLRLPLVLTAIALALTAFSSTAHAQAGAYGLFTVDRMSGIASSPILPAGVMYNDQVNPLGFTGGAFYDFKSFGPIRLGVDLRGSAINAHRGAQANSDGAGTHIYSGLGGVRLSFHTPLKFIKPYVEGAAGIGRSNYGVLSNASLATYVNPGVQTISNLEYHGYAGLDLPFAPFADWRVFEVGYGALQSFGNAAHTYPIMSISTGVVIHFPSLP
jgi:hypothetical protein